MEQKRVSNFELMRIVSLFMIIIGHIIIHGRVLENCQNDIIRLLITLMEFFLIVHVNSFILVSGYFQSNSKFKMSKLFKLINIGWIYRISIFVILVVFQVTQPTNIKIVNNTFILNMGSYWYLNTYIMLYCIVHF